MSDMKTYRRFPLLSCVTEKSFVRNKTRFQISEKCMTFMMNPPLNVPFQLFLSNCQLRNCVLYYL